MPCRKCAETLRENALLQQQIDICNAEKELILIELGEKDAQLEKAKADANGWKRAYDMLKLAYGQLMAQLRAKGD